jgi:hypothetical protein
VSAVRGDAYENGGQVATTAAQRDERRPEQPVRAPVARSTRPSRRRVIMVLNAVLIAGVAIIGLNHLHAGPADPAVASDPPGGPASTLPDPDALPSGTATAGQAPASEPPASETTSPNTGLAHPPKVATRMRSDFATGDSWPYGAGYRETGRLAWPLGVVDQLMTHGPAQAPNAVSWLERWLQDDVRRIGARVLFAPNHSGSAAITAWHTSVLDTTGLQVPRTGMRLVVQPGAWQLVALDNHGQSVIASGTYARAGRSASFDMVRRESTIWLTDPDGKVTEVDDPRIGSLSGPWASWELREGKVGDRPAGFQEIWAG